jgi:hypothetical protein
MTCDPANRTVDLRWVRLIGEEGGHRAVPERSRFTLRPDEDLEPIERELRALAPWLGGTSL